MKIHTYRPGVSCWAELTSAEHLGSCLSVGYDVAHADR